MSEKYVAEYVEILDDHGERKGVCVTDTEHTVSFEVKDEIAAMELCELLNKLFGENEELGISIKLFEDDIATKDKKIDEQQDTIRKLRNENIISKNKIEDLRTSLFMLNKELERQTQGSCLDE